MVTLAALVLGSALTAASTTDAPATESAADSAEPPVLTPHQERADRRRHRMATVHTVAGVAMEVGAGLLHALTATTFIGEELRCTSATDTQCHKGSPIVVFLPIGAIGLGWAGATRLAAGREASIWRAPLFWGGTAVTVATIPAVVGLSYAVISGESTQNERVAMVSALVAGFVIGNVIQVWGAYTAPPRDTPARTRAMSVSPGCAPTSGGVVCGLALANF